MFGITPEAFNAVEMGLPLRVASLFSDHNTRASHTQKSISVPVISVIATAWSNVLFDQCFNGLLRESRDRKHSRHALTLQNAKQDHFAGSASSAHPRSIAAKTSLLILNRTFKRRGDFFSQTYHLVRQAKVLFSAWAGSQATKTQFISKHAEHKVIEQFALDSFTESCALQETAMCVRRSTLEPTISKHPRPVILTSRTSRRVRRES